MVSSLDLMDLTRMILSQVTEAEVEEDLTEAGAEDTSTFLTWG